MPTNRQLCSDISEFLKANNIDERISYRYILNELRDSAQNFIKQDSDNRKIFKEANLWKKIPCGVDMEEIPLIECDFDINDCQSIMRSKQEIPKLYATLYGGLIKVSNIDGSGNYTQINPTDYQSNSDRRFANKQDTYFWIQNNRLYIPDKYVEAVSVIGFFKDDTYLQAGRCKSTSCLNPLEMEFNCPSYLVKIVKDSVKQQLLELFKRPIDEKPNLNTNEK